MAFLGELGRALHEGLGVQAFGPDWRAKKALLEAQVSQAPARQKSIELSNEGQSIENDTRSFGLEQAKAEVEQKRKLVEAGMIPATDLKVAEFLLAQKMSGSREKLIDAQTDKERAHAEYYRNPPQAGRPTLRVNENGEYVWFNPPNRGGGVASTGVQQPPTTDQRNRAASTDRASGVIDEIDALSQKINTLSGPTARAVGGARQVGAMGNLDPDVQTYESLISGFTPMIARAVGHVGVLTEQDVQSVRKLFPNVGDSAEVRQRKLDQVRKLMSKPQAGSISTPGPAIDGPPAATGGGGGWDEDAWLAKYGGGGE